MLRLSWSCSCRGAQLPRMCGGRDASRGRYVHPDSTSSAATPAHIMETMTDGDRMVTAFSALTADGEQHSPFLWQTRLLHQLVSTDLPKAVDIPTGLGKTSVMALWLIALAEGANLRFPRLYAAASLTNDDGLARRYCRARRRSPIVAGVLSRPQTGRGIDGEISIPIATRWRRWS